jgi:hypothetical protein
LTSVVADDRPGVVPEVAHERGHVLRHRAVAVRLVCGVGGRTGRVSVAAKVRAHDAHLGVRESGSHPPPRCVGAGMTMQEHGRPVWVAGSMMAVERDIWGHGNVEFVKVLEHEAKVPDSGVS